MESQSRRREESRSAMQSRSQSSFCSRAELSTSGGPTAHEVDEIEGRRFAKRAERDGDGLVSVMIKSLKYIVAVGNRRYLRRYGDFYPLFNYQSRNDGGRIRKGTGYPLETRRKLRFARFPSSVTQRPPLNNHRDGPANNWTS